MRRSSPAALGLGVILAGSLMVVGPVSATAQRPHWVTHPDGSFDLVAGSLVLRGAYPALEGRAVRATGVTIETGASETRIRYELARGRLHLTLGRDEDSATLEARLEGWARAPEWLHPLAGAEVDGADRFVKQGLGFGGPSGVREIPPPVARRESRTPDESWSFDSTMTTGFLAPDGATLAIGAYTHRDFLQRSTFYNRTSRMGLIDRHLRSERRLVEVGFRTEELPVAGGVLELPTLHFLAGGDAFATFRRLARHIAAGSGARLDQAPSYHWCSWYDSLKDFDRRRLDALLDGLAGLDPPSPLGAIQLDDGYSLYGDWLMPDPGKWPGGLEPAMAAIASAGYRPGLWVGPFMVDSRSDLFREHPDWILRDREGEMIVEWEREGYNVHPLDTSHPEAFAHVREVFRTARSWGVRYYKTDFMDWGLKDSTKVRRAVPGKTSVQYFVDVVRMIREEIGEDSFWLGCISPFAPMVGFVDAMRVANDVHWEWSAGGVGNMLQESVADQYFNNVLWQNDPDVLYVRTENSDLTADESLSIALWDGILGGVVNTSDRLHRLPPDRLALWRFLQPAGDRVTARLPFWDRPVTDGVYVAVQDYPDRGAWAVLVLNGSDGPMERSYEVEELIGEESAHAYVWGPGRVEPLGWLSRLELRLEPRSSRLFYLSTTPDPPPADLGLSGRRVPGLGD